MKKKVLTLLPTLFVFGTLVGCGGGGGGGDTPTGDQLESISASTKESYYYVGDSFSKNNLNVFAKYTKSDTKTLTQDQYTVDETLPYTFKEGDVANGKTFTVSYSGKTTTVTAKVNEDLFKRIDWNIEKVYNDKTLYEIAKEADEIIFGKKSECESKVAELASFVVDEGKNGYIKGYYPKLGQAPESKQLYVLIENDSHVIQFDENDRVKIESSLYGPFYKLANVKSITFSKRMNIEFKDFSNMFAGCGQLESIVGMESIPPFDTSIVTDMSSMFAGCSKLKELDLHNFSTDKVTNFNNMFNTCSELTTVYVSKDFKVNATAKSDNMFTLCSEIKGGNGTKFDKNHVNGEYARIDAEGTPGYFTFKKD